MTKRLLGVSKDGQDVFVINDNKHMAAHAAVSDSILAEGVGKIEINDRPFLMDTVDLGRIIGVDDCVAVTDADDVRLLQRKARKGLSRIVFGRKAEPTRLLTIGICRDDDNLLTVFTAFFGVKAPKEPWDCKTEQERAESDAFWAGHALVFNPEALEKTE